MLEVICVAGACGIRLDRTCLRNNEDWCMRRSIPSTFVFNDKLSCTDRKHCFSLNEAALDRYTSSPERKSLLLENESAPMGSASSNPPLSFHHFSRPILENLAEMNLNVHNKGAEQHSTEMSSELNLHVFDEGAQKHSIDVPNDHNSLETLSLAVMGEDEVDNWLSQLPECSESSEWVKLPLEEAFKQMSTVYSANNCTEKCVSLIQKCKRSGSLAAANRAYAHMCENGLEVHGVLGSYLVAMYVYCWSLTMAQQVFSRLLHHNQYSWTNLIQGYIEGGDPEHGLHLYAKMKEDGIWPNRFTYVLALRACTALKCIKRGQQVHTETIRDFKEDPSVARALLDFYVKCGLCLEAHDVYDDLHRVAEFSEENLKSLCSSNQVFENSSHGIGDLSSSQMPSSALAYVFALKACSSMQALPRGCQLHIQIVKEGHDQDQFVLNTLIDMYAKCGLLSEAWKMLQWMTKRDVVSWTALITGCVENGLCEDALVYIEMMEKEGVPPNVFTLASGLRACGITRDLDSGHRLHALIMKEGLYTDYVICNTLVDMYAKCGLLDEARDVFEKFAKGDIISWTSLISGYTDHGFYKEALDCFQYMEAAGVSPNTVTYACCLKACAFTANLEMGRRLHNSLVNQEFEAHTIIGNALLHMYARCGLYLETRAIFDDLPCRDVISWTVLISDLAGDGQGEQALEMLERMPDEGLSPGSYAYVSSLKACSMTGTMEGGRMLHMEIIKRGLERSPFIIKALIGMYAECGKPITL